MRINCNANSSSGLCSTPYGITAIYIALCGRAQSLDAVLNALRHHSYLHQSPSYPPAPILMCSTPYGITAIYIAEGGAAFLDAVECSTPYGITAIYITPREYVTDPSMVLNALRHHSYLHDHLRPNPHDDTNVLNALRHHSYLHLIRRGSRHLQCVVLNALRHHSYLHARDNSQRLR